MPLHQLSEAAVGIHRVTLFAPLTGLRSNHESSRRPLFPFLIRDMAQEPRGLEALYQENTI
jgi:hypothetical protein